MRRTAATFLVGLGLIITIGAQTKAPLMPADYGQWETLTAVGSRGGLSPDGKWLAYGIGYSEALEEKLRKDKKPVQRKLGLQNLASGEEMIVEGVESFAFSASGAYLAMRRYPPEKKETPDAPGADDTDDTPAATLIVRHLVSGRDTTFGNVTEFAWQDLPGRGRLLAMTISAEDKTGNGVQLFDPDTGVLRVLDSSASTYGRLAWRKDSADLAVLRSKADERHDGPTLVALAWTRLGDASEARHVYDPVADEKFPPGMRLVAFRKPSWSDDGGIVFLGVAKWNEKRTDTKKNTTTEESHDGGAGLAAKDEAEPAAVEVWHARDVDVMPKQRISARNDRQRNILAAWHVEAGRLGTRRTRRI